MVLKADSGFARLFIAKRDDRHGAPPYMTLMRTVLIFAPLFALLALAIWFAAAAWAHIGGDAIPLYGYVAIGGGVLVSLLVGGGLMALVFYSNRHGYDDEANRFDK